MDFKSIVNLSIKELSIDSAKSNISIYYEEVGPNYTEPYHLNPKDTAYSPASLIKLFNAYLAKVKILSQVKSVLNRSEESEDFGKRTSADDIYDAIHQSISVSDNDALSLLVDYNSDTQSGLRLDQEGFAEFAFRRKKTTDLFKSKNYSDALRLHSKCFSFAPYGRDEQLVFSNEGLGPNSCKIEDIVRIMKDIYRDFPDLYKPMSRIIGVSNDEQTQFIAKGLEQHRDQVKEFYSKAGWTSTVRHDAALIKLQDNREVLLVIMTKGLSEYPDLIPSLAQAVIASLRVRNDISL